VNELDFPDRHLALAAEGWLDLQDPDEAARELAQISPTGRCHPSVLEVRWRVCAGRRLWPEALEVARELTQVAPEQPEGWIHQSYTLHELRRTDEAWDALLRVADRFPNESIISYNLACYACQRGDLNLARQWLQQAVRLRSKEEIRALASSDPDLEPIRDYVAAL
jgi:tetratricopeptide (TPR) repeat protein